MRGTHGRHPLVGDPEELTGHGPHPGQPAALERLLLRHREAALAENGVRPGDGSGLDRGIDSITHAQSDKARRMNVIEKERADG